MRVIGRFGQFVGLAVPPLAILLQLGGAVSLGQMLVMLLFAACSFWIGRILEGYDGR